MSTRTLAKTEGWSLPPVPTRRSQTRTAFLTNPTYGREMAQDGLYGGVPFLLHDGTDTVEWTFSNEVGAKGTADSTTRFYDGSKAIEWDNPNVGDIIEIINDDGPGNDIDMTGSYVAMTFWINVDKNWVLGDSFSLYARIGAATAGNAVNIEDYFDYTTHDTWHYVNIPLTDLGIDSTSIDAVWIENNSRAGAKSPTFYIDEWYLQVSGAAITYTLRPNDGTWFHVKAFQTTFVDALNADNADSTMPHLSYDQILGLSTSTGYIYERYSARKTDPIFTARITNLMDLLSYPYSKITNAISDGTNTLITIENTYPTGIDFVLKAEDGDRIEYTIEDSFDDLLYFRVCAQGFEEQR